MELPVRYEDRLVATISADAQATRLAYDSGWLSSPDRFPVSLAMPIQPEPYDAELGRIDIQRSQFMAAAR